MASAPDNFAPSNEAQNTSEKAPSEIGVRIDRTPHSLEASFNSDPAHLAPVRTAIESLCTDAGFDAKATGEIGLVVNEAVANIIRHAYGSTNDKPIRVRAEITATAIEISLRDWGPGKKPARLASKTPPDPLTPGGLGLVCMHNLMDQVLFTPQPRGMLLTMRRARPV
jgi:serine/threonine-protein kinase RsbW